MKKSVNENNGKIILIEKKLKLWWIFHLLYRWKNMLLMKIANLLFFDLYAVIVLFFFRLLFLFILLIYLFWIILFLLIFILFLIFNQFIL